MFFAEPDSGAHDGMAEQRDAPAPGARIVAIRPRTWSRLSRRETRALCRRSGELVGPKRCRRRELNAQETDSDKTIELDSLPSWAGVLQSPGVSSDRRRSIDLVGVHGFSAPERRWSVLPPPRSRKPRPATDFPVMIPEPGIAHECPRENVHGHDEPRLIVLDELGGYHASEAFPDRSWTLIRRRFGRDQADRIENIPMVVKAERSDLGDAHPIFSAAAPA